MLRFVVPLGFPSTSRVQALLGLRSLNPDLGMDVTEAEDPISRIGDPFDLMFHFGRPPEREGWFSHVVARIPTRLRASPAYLEQQGTPSSIAELAEHTLLHWRVPGYADDRLPLRDGEFAEISPWVVTANLLLLIGLAEAGAGLLFSPVPPKSFGAGGTGLVPVLEETVGGEVTLRALSPRPGRSDPRVQALLDHVKRMIVAIDQGQ